MSPILMRIFSLTDFLTNIEVSWTDFLTNIEVSWTDPLLYTEINNYLINNTPDLYR
jgi:hypothetical protein